jgi:hypothetical protein
VLALVPLAAAATRPEAALATGPAPSDAGKKATEPLTRWLEAHGVTYGIGAYWNASVVTLQSGGRVAIRTVDLGPGPHHVGWSVYVRGWETNALWYDPARRDARWAIADTSGSGYTVRTYESLFGKPEAIYRVSYWLVLEYRANLLSEIKPVQS